MKHKSWIAILDFGSQYNQLITRRVREIHVYSELVRFDITAAELKARKPKGIIFSGGPASPQKEGSPLCDEALFDAGIPILGICYGMQMTAHMLGGVVKSCPAREYGSVTLSVLAPDAIFRGLPKRMKVWMSHGDQVEAAPAGFKVLAKTETCPVAAMCDAERGIYGVQFHPEVIHTPRGTDVLKNFVFGVCKCRGDWTMAAFVKESIRWIRKRVGDDHVLCALSGGVDSSVVAALLQKAIGRQLHCIFVDNGVLRYGEAAEVRKTFGEALGIDLRTVDASKLFLENLKGVVEPETKRKIIGKTFIDVFAEEARKLGDIKYLAQGTLYPDVIESFSPIGGPSATIKTHHNVGGLPDDLKFELIEPLRELFKDEVRVLGRELGLPEKIVARQPFPGPGLAVRILGEVTEERVAMLQQADLRVQEEVCKLDNYQDIWQSFAVLLPVQTVGVMGDSRTYENVIALRIVESRDAMTADWFRLPYDVLARISNRIINEVRGINRVVYDVSSKPPATIEWE